MGQVVARIAEPDFASRFNSANRTFLEDQIKEERHILTSRASAIEQARQQRTDRTGTLKFRLQNSADNLFEANTFLKKEVEHLGRDLRDARNNLGAGIITRTRIEQIRTDLTTRELQIVENRGQHKQIEIELAELAVDEAKSDLEAEIALNSINRELVELNLRTQMLRDGSSLEIRAPADGLLVPKQFKIGQKVNVGDTLFDLVHDDTNYLFQVDLSSSQIGSLANEAPVKISVDAFPYFEHGFIEARVEDFTGIPSRVPSGNKELLPNSSYRLNISPEDQSLRAFLSENDLLPGMIITAHIQKEKVPIWRMMFASILRVEARLGL